MSKQLPRRFWIFGGPEYYPRGGLHDFRASRDTLQGALTFAQKMTSSESASCDWWQIFDMEERRVIWQSHYQGYGAPDSFPDLDK